MTEQFLSAATLTQFIKSHSIEAEVLILNEPTPTVQAAAQVVGTQPEKIIKSILFLAEGVPLLALASGTDRIEYKALRSYLNISRRKICLASATETLKYTGYPVGAVPPFGHITPLRTLMDAALLSLGEVYGGGGALNALMRIRVETIRDVAGAEIVNLRQIAQKE